MVNSRTDATLVRVVGLEKAVAEIKLQFQKRTDRLEAFNSQLEDLIMEFRASWANETSSAPPIGASPLMTFPKFEGSEALAWLARANHYFVVNKTPLDRRVENAIVAISGPAMPWLKLLIHRCPSLSWDRFVHELLKRFDDSAILPYALPLRTETTLHVVQQPPPIPPIQQPLPMLETTPLLPSSPDIPLLQPPSVPPPQQKWVPAIATFQPTPTISLSGSTHALLDVHSMDGSQFCKMGKKITTSKLTPVAFSCPTMNILRPSATTSHTSHLPSAGNERSNKNLILYPSFQHSFQLWALHLLLHVYGHIFVCTPAFVRKHEYDPPPDNILCFRVSTLALQARLF